MPKLSIVILSEAKNLRQNVRSFASLRMTAVGFQQSRVLIKHTTHTKMPSPPAPLPKGEGRFESPHPLKVRGEDFVRILKLKLA
jgi:hypothetical protein